MFVAMVVFPVPPLPLATLIIILFQIHARIQVRHFQIFLSKHKDKKSIITFSIYQK